MNTLLTPNNLMIDNSESKISKLEQNNMEASSNNTPRPRKNKKCIKPPKDTNTNENLDEDGKYRNMEEDRNLELRMNLLEKRVEHIERKSNSALKVTLV